MGRIKRLLIAKLNEESLISLANRGYNETKRDIVDLLVSILEYRDNSEELMKVMAGNHTKITINKLYKCFTVNVWLFYVRYHIYYIMPNHVRSMPQEAQDLYKDSQEHTYHAIMNDASDKEIESARYVDYLLNVASKG